MGPYHDWDWKEYTDRYRQSNDDLEDIKIIVSPWVIGIIIFLLLRWIGG